MTSCKRLIALITFGVVTAGLTACDDGESSPSGPPADLVVEYAAWNGWDPDHVPTPQFATLTGAVGEEVTLDTLDDVTIKVVDVDAEEITIELSEPMAPGDGAGVDITDTTMTFVVSPHEPAEFATPTLDAGWNFEVRFDHSDRPSGSPTPPCNPEYAGCGQPVE